MERGYFELNSDDNTDFFGRKWDIGISHKTKNLSYSDVISIINFNSLLLKNSTVSDAIFKKYNKTIDPALYFFKLISLHDSQVVLAHVETTGKTERGYGLDYYVEQAKCIGIIYETAFSDLERVEFVMFWVCDHLFDRKIYDGQSLDYYIDQMDYIQLRHYAQMFARGWLSGTMAPERRVLKTIEQFESIISMINAIYCGNENCNHKHCTMPKYNSLRYVVEIAKAYLQSDSKALRVAISKLFY